MAGVKGRSGRRKGSGMSAAEANLRGTYRRSRHGPLPDGARILAMPVKHLPTVVPPPPVELTDAERLKWDAMISEYPAADRHILWLFCSTWVDWRTARDGVRAIGPLMKDIKTGRPVPNPWLDIARDARKELTGYLALLSLSRSKEAKHIARESTRLERFIAANRRGRSHP